MNHLRFSLPNRGRFPDCDLCWNHLPGRHISTSASTPAAAPMPAIASNTPPKNMNGAIMTIPMTMSAEMATRLRPYRARRENAHSQKPIKPITPQAGHRANAGFLRNAPEAATVARIAIGPTLMVTMAPRQMAIVLSLPGRVDSPVAELFCWRSTLWPGLDRSVLVRPNTAGSGEANPRRLASSHGAVNMTTCTTGQMLPVLHGYDSTRSVPVLIQV